MGFFSNLFGRTGDRASAPAIDAGDEAFEAAVRRTIADMKGELHAAVRASAEAMSAYNRIEASYVESRRSSEGWRDRARAALESGDEALARAALARQLEHDAAWRSIRPEFEDARHECEKLRTRVSGLRRRIGEAERNAETLIARKNATRAQKRVGEAIADADDNAFEALRAFEARVTSEEAGAIDSAARATPAPPGVDEALASLRAEMDRGA